MRDADANGQQSHRQHERSLLGGGYQGQGNQPNLPFLCAKDTLGGCVYGL